MKLNIRPGRWSLALLLLSSLLSLGCNSATSPTTGSTGLGKQAPVDVDRTSIPASVEDDSSSQIKPRLPRVEEEEEPTAVRAEEKEVPPESPPPIPEGAKALNKEKTLFFEKLPNDKRRVHLLAEVCLREGPLEVFLCKLNTKEHESILHVNLDVRDIHFALVAAGAKPGTTVRFAPEYKPATGDVIKVTLTYHMNGKLLTKPAQYWVQDIKTKKDMPHDWVFAGSRFFKDPENPNKLPYYCANNGEVICISNFADSMMDLPVMSSKEQAELEFIAHTERIPPLKTKVLVTLEVLRKK